MTTKLTKAALVAELEAARIALARAQAENASLKSIVAENKPRINATFCRPVRVMTLDREWAFRARNQLARNGDKVACQPVSINRCGRVVTAWAVF